MRHGIHSSFTPVRRWLCLVHVRLGIVTPVGRFHPGAWPPGALPEPVRALLRLGCAAGTRRGRCTSVRGSLSILAPAPSTTSCAIDVLLDRFILPPLPDGGLVDPAHCVMRGSVRMPVRTPTRLDRPRG